VGGCSLILVGTDRGVLFSICDASVLVRMGYGLFGFVFVVLVGLGGGVWRGVGWGWDKNWGVGGVCRWGLGVGVGFGGVLG